MNKRVFSVALLLFTLAPLCYSQQAPKTSPAAQAQNQKSVNADELTIDQVVQLIRAGLSEDIVIAKIRKNGKAFDLNANQLLQLKEAKAADNVIRVLMDPQSAIPSAPGQAQAVQPTSTSSPSKATTEAIPASSDPNDPDGPHDSGIYLLVQGPGTAQNEMIALEPAAYTGSKTGGTFAAAMTAGIVKAKQKAIIQGNNASVRNSTADPVFYFYFEDKATALGKAGMFGTGSITSPNQFTCIKLDVKDRTRETIIMEIGAFGASSGTNQKAIRAFKSTRIRPGVYKVTFLENLEPGEYAFLAGTAMGGATMAGAAMPLQIFDFAISSGK